MIEVFKTNICNEADAERLLVLMKKRWPLFCINFDLEDCDKILRVKGDNLCAEEIMNIVTQQGFECAILMDA